MDDSHSQSLRRQRDAALIREAETAFGLQRMFSVDKAVSMLICAHWGKCVAALHRWCRNADQLRLGSVSVAAANRLTAEISARLEAEEGRRFAAERLAYDENRRRQCIMAVVRVLDIDEQITGAQREALPLALATWRSVVSHILRLEYEADQRPLLLRLETLERQAADAVAAQHVADHAKREASEAHLKMLAACQQQAEALAKAAAQEQSHLNVLARLDALDGRHAGLVSNLGLAARSVSWLRIIGPYFRTWGSKAARRSAVFSVEGATSSRPASASNAVALARADVERISAATEMRLARSDAARQAEVRRHAIEAGMFADELRCTEWYST